MANPWPQQSKLHAEVQQFAEKLSAHLTPKSTAYHEIWLDKKVVAGGANSVVADVEPLYGPTYLPRKFKVAIAVPPKNDVDVFAHVSFFISSFFFLAFFFKTKQKKIYLISTIEISASVLLQLKIRTLAVLLASTFLLAEAWV